MICFVSCSWKFSVLMTICWDSIWSFFVKNWDALWYIFKMSEIDCDLHQQKSGTFEPFTWCGWALLMKCWLLNRLSSRPSLDFGRWQVSCWGCPEGTCTWISRYFPPKMIQNFSFLMFLRLWRLYLTCLKELRNWGFVGGSIDSLNYSCYVSIEFFIFLQFCPVSNNDWAHFNQDAKFQQLNFSSFRDQSAGQNP